MLMSDNTFDANFCATQTGRYQPSVLYKAEKVNTRTQKHNCNVFFDFAYVK